MNHTTRQLLAVTTAVLAGCTTLLAQKEIVELIKERGVDIKTVFGGAPCTKAWCDEIGADGYSASAPDCVDLINSIY